MLNNIAADPELKELAKEDKVLEATLQKAQSCNSLLSLAKV